jgi:hypothetical protein
VLALTDALPEGQELGGDVFGHLVQSSAGISKPK